MNQKLNHMLVAAIFVCSPLYLTSCDSYVDDTLDPIDSISDDQLNLESEIPFLINGLKSRFAQATALIGVYSGGLSDELVFDDQAPLATFPEFREMDAGAILPSSFQMEEVFSYLGELRFYSDNLNERADGTSFDDPALENEARFVANFYGGIARYFFATHWGLNPTEGGGVISESQSQLGSFIPSEEMYDLASAKFDQALEFADPVQTRVIQTLLARISLFRGDFETARLQAMSGMTQGDAPLDAIFSTLAINRWTVEAGVDRAQLVTNDRYESYLTENSTEAGRVLLAPISSFDGSALFVPGIYPTRSTPIAFVTWQENELILAEVEIRSGDAAAALLRINTIRASHGVSPASSATLDDLIDERDKELFATGMRLPDQRRFDIWHLDSGTWQFLPIPLTERSQNPNL